MRHKHEGEVALYNHEFGKGLYLPLPASAAEDRARFIRRCAKDSGGALTSQDIEAVVDCFGGARADVIAEAKVLGIPLK